MHALVSRTPTWKPAAGFLFCWYSNARTVGSNEHVSPVRGMRYHAFSLCMQLRRLRTYVHSLCSCLISLRGLGPKKGSRAQTTNGTMFVVHVVHFAPICMCSHHPCSNHLQAYLPATNGVSSSLCSPATTRWQQPSKY